MMSCWLTDASEGRPVTFSVAEGAQASIQRRIVATSVSESRSFFPGGILPSWTILKRRLSLTLPRTMTGPDSLPWKAPSRLLRSKPAFRGFGPWQRVQCARKIGCTAVSNRGLGVAGTAGFFCSPSSSAGGTARPATEVMHTSPKPAQTITANPSKRSHGALRGVVMLATLKSTFCDDPLWNLGRMATKNTKSHKREKAAEATPGLIGFFSCLFVFFVAIPLPIGMDSTQPRDRLAALGDDRLGSPLQVGPLGAEVDAQVAEDGGPEIGGSHPG